MTVIRVLNDTEKKWLAKSRGRSLVPYICWTVVSIPTTSVKWNFPRCDVPYNHGVREGGV